ncbi:putative gustatory receptor clone PTE03 [Sphaeramia orbicularis]|uniref:putative gustatory receptor clone PTE03 n=1 Tax=Sphaeramia orbicularis TaxID=375764 RepID=UPI0011804643|nr:putative gustatory receptor clone PTE03 [Sphaeramia orbicularis]
MDENFTVTYITFGGYVEVEKYKYAYFAVIFITYILIICSNSTIICLICIHPNLHEPMYIFIAALLVNSVLYSTVVYPKLLIDVLSEKQVISYSACLFQYFMFYVLVSSEFLFLAAMAYDRYVSICKPLQYPTIMRKTTVTVLLVLPWLIPVCELLLAGILILNERVCKFTLPSIFCNNSVHKLHCVKSQAITICGVFLLINLTLCPVVFILYTYSRIFIITYRSSPEVRKKAAQTCLPHLLVLVCFSFLLTYNVVIVRLEADMPKTVFLIMTLQLVLYHPLFNPIIYGLKMTEIYRHLKNLLCPPKLN